MPLEKGPDAVGHNIAELEESGHPAKQAEAIALKEARDADPKGGEAIEDPAGKTIGYGYRGQNPVKRGDGGTFDYDPDEMAGDFKVAGKPGLTLAEIQAYADDLWKRQYNDGPLGSAEPGPIDPV